MDKERFKEACGVAVNRFDDAIAIQAGACNPSGVARALVRAINACFVEEMDTAAICADPAVRLIAHQLAYLLHANDVELVGDEYHRLTVACEAHLGVPS